MYFEKWTMPYLQMVLNIGCFKCYGPLFQIHKPCIFSKNDTSVSVLCSFSITYFFHHSKRKNLFWLNMTHFFSKKGSRAEVLVPVLVSLPVVVNTLEKGFTLAHSSRVQSILVVNSRKQLVTWHTQSVSTVRSHDTHSQEAKSNECGCSLSPVLHLHSTGF